MFLGGRERVHWEQMGWKKFIKLGTLLVIPKIKQPVKIRFSIPRDRVLNTLLPSKLENLNSMFF